MVEYDLVCVFMTYTYISPLICIICIYDIRGVWLSSLLGAHGGSLDENHCLFSLLWWLCAGPCHVGSWHSKAPESHKFNLIKLLHSVQLRGKDVVVMHHHAMRNYNSYTRLIRLHRCVTTGLRPVRCRETEHAIRTHSQRSRRSVGYHWKGLPMCTCLFGAIAGNVALPRERIEKTQS